MNERMTRKGPQAAESTHEEVRMLRDSADALFADHVTTALLVSAEAGQFAHALWDQIGELGFIESAVSEAGGGAGLPLRAALSVCFDAGLHALPLPLGETIIARWLLDRAGVAAPEGLIALALGADFATGTARNVPWARHAAHVLALSEEPAQVAEVAPRLLLIEAGACEIAPHGNIAGEPRDVVRWKVGALEADAVDLPAHLGRTASLAGPAIRSLQLAGAMARALEMTVRYAGERVQFGKPLGKLQAIQQYLAVMAGQTASARVAAEFALERLEDQNESMAVATAKVRCGQAAALVARHAHQIHGAMGFTHEHPLHWTTRRMWAWRDEYGNESTWAERLTQAVMAAGADDLWATVTECSSTEAAICK